MATVLHISASPCGASSESVSIAEAYLDARRAADPALEVQAWDLWDGSLPEFGPDAAGAKMAVFAGQDPTGLQADAWARATATFERLAAADEYVFSVPMWNAGVPYILKQFIDVVSQPGMVFGFDAVEGYTGLLAGKSATVVYTSAVYGENRPASFGDDFQAPFFDGWLSWAGIRKLGEVTFRPNLVTENADAARLAAHEDARRLASVVATKLAAVAG